MLKQTIQNDLNKAVKEKNEIERSVLRLVFASILNKQKEKRYKISKQEPEATEQELIEKSNLTAQEIVEVISSEAKKRKEAIIEYEKGGRKELVKKEKKEFEILKRYLPKQLSEQELELLVKEAINKLNVQDIKDLGKIMAELMPKIKGRADGNEVIRIVKKNL